MILKLEDLSIKSFVTTEKRYKTHNTGNPNCNDCQTDIAAQTTCPADNKE